MEIRKLDQMFEVLSSRAKKRLVAAWAVDAHTIEAAATAAKIGIVEAILVGDETRILQVCAQKNPPGAGGAQEAERPCPQVEALT